MKWLKRLVCNQILKTPRYQACGQIKGQFYVKTGFAELDAIIGGWERQEELVIVKSRKILGLLKCRSVDQLGMYQEKEREKSWTFCTLLIKYARKSIERIFRFIRYSIQRLCKSFDTNDKWAQQ